MRLDLGTYGLLPANNSYRSCVSSTSDILAKGREAPYGDGRANFFWSSPQPLQICLTNTTYMLSLPLHLAAEICQPSVPYFILHGYTRSASPAGPSTNYSHRLDMIGASMPLASIGVSAHISHNLATPSGMLLS